MKAVWAAAVAVMLLAAGSALAVSPIEGCDGEIWDCYEWCESQLKGDLASCDWFDWACAWGAYRKYESCMRFCAYIVCPENRRSES